MEENVLYEDHPAMFRNHPILFILYVLLSFVVVGLILFLIWWLQCKGTTLKVTDRRTTLRKGILSKYTNEVFHDNVRNIQIRQSFFQRLFGVGSIGISSAGQDEIEIEVKGIPNPYEVKKLIESARYHQLT